MGQVRDKTTLEPDPFSKRMVPHLDLVLTWNVLHGYGPVLSPPPIQVSIPNPIKILRFFSPWYNLMRTHELDST